MESDESGVTSRGRGKRSAIQGGGGERGKDKERNDLKIHFDFERDDGPRRHNLLSRRRQHSEDSESNNTEESGGLRRRLPRSSRDDRPLDTLNSTENTKGINCNEINKGKENDTGVSAIRMHSSERLKYIRRKLKGTVNTMIALYSFKDQASTRCSMVLSPKNLKPQLSEIREERRSQVELADMREALEERARICSEKGRDVVSSKEDTAKSKMAGKQGTQIKGEANESDRSGLKIADECNGGHDSRSARTAPSLQRQQSELYRRRRGRSFKSLAADKPVVQKTFLESATDLFRMSVEREWIRNIWRMLVSISIAYNCIIIPLQLCFASSELEKWDKYASKKIQK